MGVKEPFQEFGEAEDPFNLIHRIEFEDAQVMDFSVEEIPEAILSDRPQKRIELPEPQPPDKIHPLLAEWVAERRGNEREVLIITFQDDLELPRFPEVVGRMSHATLKPTWRLSIGLRSWSKRSRNVVPRITRG